jgi:hypothetical protein
MSRQSPTGFVFSMAVEIAAVVVIVSFLPRVDLRPSATAADGTYAPANAGQPAAAEPVLSRLDWKSTGRVSAEPPTRETSYYQRPAAPSQPESRQARSLPSREAPPLIDVDSARPQYVEQRLDRASQQLVNSVGSYVAQAAGNLVNFQSASASPPLQTSSSVTPAFSPTAILPPATTPQPTYSAPPVMPSRRQGTGSFSTQPRPWIRY